MMTRKGTVCSCDVVVCLVVIFTLSSAQTFLKHPESAKVPEGSHIILYCEVENIQGATVQWTRDNFGLGPGRELPSFGRYRLTGSEERGQYNLLINNVQLMDDAVFQCQIGATDTTKGVSSEKATVTVLVPPEKPYIDGGAKVAVVAGRPTNITCHADNGKPAATLTWIAGGSPVEDEGSIQYSTVVAGSGNMGKLMNATSDLTVTASKFDEGKRYQCEATSEALTTGKRVETILEVHYPPELTMTVSPMKKVRENSSVRFTCDAEANPSAITWKWYRMAEEIPGETSRGMELQKVGYDLHTKTISCEASNAVGSTQQSYTLEVQYGPRFTAEPEHVAVDRGQDAVLDCHADGNPAPSIVWRKKGQESGKIWSSQNHLRLSSVSADMFGIYVCEAWVIGFDQRVSMEVHLLENGAPKVVSDSSQSARFGEDAELVCVVRSVPKPTSLVWSRNGKVVDVTELDRYYLREEDLPDGKRSVLEIQSVQDSDFGDYNCTVNNGHGEDYMTINFSKKDVVNVAFILVGVLVGVFIVIIIAVGVFLYLRHKAKDDSSSDSSESTITKKSQEPDVTRMDHTDALYGGPIDAWRRDLDPAYRHSAEYDELSYPTRDPRAPSSVYDYRDNGYGNNGYNDFRNYGTYPGPAGGRGFDPRYNDDIYGPTSYPGSDYGSYRPQPQGGSDYAPAPPPPEFADYGPPASLSSRLSTNV